MSNILQLTLVFIFTYFEVLSRIIVLGHVVRIHFAAIFIMYMLFRVRDMRIIPLVLLHIVVVNPFTGYSFIQLILSYAIVLGLIWRVREQIYTETYLTMCLWLFALVFLHQVVLKFVFARSAAMIVDFSFLIPLVINCLLSAFLALPLFLLFDRFLDPVKSKADRHRGHQW